MVLDSVARIVKVQLPAYLKQLPVPDSITGFARLTGTPPAAVHPCAPPRGRGWGCSRDSPARSGAGRQALHVTRGPCAPVRRRAAGWWGRVPGRGAPAGGRRGGGAEFGAAGLLPVPTTACIL